MDRQRKGNPIAGANRPAYRACDHGTRQESLGDELWGNRLPRRRTEGRDNTAWCSIIAWRLPADWEFPGAAVSRLLEHIGAGCNYWPQPSDLAFGKSKAFAPYF